MFIAKNRIKSTFNGDNMSNPQEPNTIDGDVEAYQEPNTEAVQEPNTEAFQEPNTEAFEQEPNTN
jgi:hypothetical protein